VGESTRPEIEPSNPEKIFVPNMASFTPLRGEVAPPSGSKLADGEASLSKISTPCLHD
jgi:hypothetical protein